MKNPQWEKIGLVLILILAAVIRFWKAPSYFPFFWDEAKYLCEIEGIYPHFGVNAGAFAFLKFGYTIFGRPAYPQIVTAITGFITVFGFFLIGRRLSEDRRIADRLGLLMAAQCALLPYVLQYSRHAFATIFALCAFSYALYFYIGKASHPRVKNRKGQMRYLRYSGLAAGFLALVPASSFKFLLPTLLLFFIWEISIWRRRAHKHKEYNADLNLWLSMFGGLLLFVLLPVLIAYVSGYSRWLDRVFTLSHFHAQIQTMRLAFHFLYPAHIYYFAGPVFALSALAGSVFLFITAKSRISLKINTKANILILFSFVVYVLFFGLFSHLQSARLFVLTLPFAVYAAAVFIIRIKYLLPRFGGFAAGIIAVLLLASLGYLSTDYISKSSGIKAACDAIMQNLRTEKMIYANAKDQVAYGLMNSPFWDRRIRFNVKSFLFLQNISGDSTRPPAFVIQDGVDLVSTVASFDKRDFLDQSAFDSLQVRLIQYRSVARISDRIFTLADNFYTTPYYFLEDVYSWKSYEYIRELMPRARDSIFVYFINPTKIPNNGQ